MKRRALADPVDQAPDDRVTRILLLTFYYPPDLCAGSFRAIAMVEALQAHYGREVAIDVVTTLPNRYQSHLAEAPEFEARDGLRIVRLPLPSHRSGLADQARAFTSFARQAWAATRGGKWDVVVATSSRLMTAALGAQVARRVDARLYLDIRDLFTDTMQDLLKGRWPAAALPLFRWIEATTFRAADRVNVVSGGFLDHAAQIAPGRTFATFSNGIDEEFLNFDFSKRDAPAHETPLIVYAGNMGEGQGLHDVIPAAAALLDSRARFRVIGDGGKRAELLAGLGRLGVRNVELLDAVPRERLFEHYRDADMLLVHLNDHDAFKKVLPSKLFEYAATGKPILAGVAGFPAEFLRTHVPDTELFAPCDAAGLAAAVERFDITGTKPDRTAFIARFARRSIMREMAADIARTAREPRHTSISTSRDLALAEV